MFLSTTSGWCRDSFIKVDYDEDGRLWHVLFCVEVIDEVKRRENYLQYLAETDLMTNITNRGTGEKLVKDLLARKVSGLFCLIDCDNFKSINDKYGHNIGDKVLVALAKCLTKTCKETDVVFRLGGDEFAVYSTDYLTEMQAQQFFEKLFDNVDKLKIPKYDELKICISVGAALFVGGKASFDQLYKQADIAMYESKKIEGSKATIFQNN